MGYAVVWLCRFAVLNGRTPARLPVGESKLLLLAYHLQRA